MISRRGLFSLAALPLAAKFTRPAAITPHSPGVLRAWGMVPGAVLYGPRSAGEPQWLEDGSLLLPPGWRAEMNWRECLRGQHA